MEVTDTYDFTKLSQGRIRMMLKIAKEIKERLDPPSDSSSEEQEVSGIDSVVTGSIHVWDTFNTFLAP